MNTMKRQKDMTLKDEHIRLVGAQQATKEEQKCTSGKKEEDEPTQNNSQLWVCLVVTVKSDALKNDIA